MIFGGGECWFAHRWGSRNSAGACRVTFLARWPFVWRPRTLWSCRHIQMLRPLFCLFLIWLFYRELRLVPGAIYFQAPIFLAFASSSRSISCQSQFFVQAILFLSNKHQDFWWIPPLWYSWYPISPCHYSSHYCSSCRVIWAHHSAPAYLFLDSQYPSCVAVSKTHIPTSIIW